MTTIDYPRPEFTKEDNVHCARVARRLILGKTQGDIIFVATMLIMENMRLTTEINEHRATLGISLLPTFDPKP